MSYIDWSLRRANAGLLQSFTGWGIRSAVRNSINQGVGTLTLGFGATDLLAASPFDPDEELLILRQGLPWFRGRITGEKRGAYGSSEGLTVILSDPWWYLEKLVYTEEAQFVDSPNANPTPADPSGILQATDFTLVTAPISQVTLGTIDSRAQILKALNYAISKGAPIGIGTIDPGINIPLDTLRDTTCAELIRKSVRWTPDQSTFWDFSVTPPQLHIRSRANRSIQAIDLAGLTVSEVELVERRDLALSGVTINYLQKNDRFGTQFQTLSQDQAGPDPLGLNALIFTQELQGNYLIQNIAVGGYLVGTRLVAGQVVPIGIAAVIYAARQVAPWDGRINLVYDDLPDVAWLTHTTRVLNGFAGWASATMDLQQVSENIFSGRVELTVGPPAQLGPSDLLGLLRQSQTSGGSLFPEPVPPPVPPKVPPANPPPSFTFGPPLPGVSIDVVLNSYWNAATNIFNPGYSIVGYDTGQVVDESGSPLSGQYGGPGFSDGTIDTYEGILLTGDTFTVRFLYKHNYLCPPSPPIPDPNPQHGSEIVTVVLSQATNEKNENIASLKEVRSPR